MLLFILDYARLPRQHGRDVENVLLFLQDCSRICRWHYIVWCRKVIVVLQDYSRICRCPFVFKLILTVDGCLWSWLLLNEHINIGSALLMDVSSLGGFVEDVSAYLWFSIEWRSLEINIQYNNVNKQWYNIERFNELHCRIITSLSHNSPRTNPSWQGSIAQHYKT